MINASLSVMTTGSTKHSIVLNFAICTKTDKFYAERTDFSLDEVNSNKVAYTIFNKQQFNPQEQFKNVKTREDGQSITLIKDHDDNIRKELKEFIDVVTHNGREKITFWIDSPVTWLFFIDLCFNQAGEAPVLPEEIINPYPMELNTLFQFIFNGKNMEDIIPDLDDNIVYNSFYRSQYIYETSKELFSKLNDEDKNDSNEEEVKEETDNNDSKEEE